MTENPKQQEKMGSDYLMSNYVNETRKNSDDSFVVVDVQGVSPPITEKDINANSRLITRSLSRKGSSKRCGGGEKKTNHRNAVLQTNPPTATSNGGSTPGMIVVGPTESPVHHITINNVSNAPAESTHGVMRFDSKHSSRRNWAVDPRRILLFFATLSSMGTILLIYFTLSMRKLNGDDDIDLN